MPAPSALVVKKGWKMRSTMFGGHARAAIQYAQAHAPVVGRPAQPHVSWSVLPIQRGLGAVEQQVAQGVDDKVLVDLDEDVGSRER